MQSMYKVVVKSFILKSKAVTFEECLFKNKVDGTFIFDIKLINDVIEAVSNEIHHDIKTHEWYGGIDEDVATTFEVVNDLRTRVYISFACKTSKVKVVVEFIEV